MKFRSLMTAICVLATANIVSAQPFAYVANSGTKNVSVIDTFDNTIKATVTLPDDNGATLPNPYAYSVTVGASGQYVYVGLQSTNEVVVIDAATNTVVKRISLGSDSPGGLAVNAAETRLYVASNMSNTLIVIDITGTGASEAGRVAVETSAVSNPEGVVLNPAGTKAYVANSSKGTIAEITLDEVGNIYTRTNLIALGNNAQPMGLTISADGNKLYAASLNGHASAIDTSSLGVTDLPLVSGIDVANGNVSVAINPADNTKIYAPSNSVSKIYVIDGSANTVSGTTYATTDAPFGSSVTPGGAKLFLTMSSKSTVQVFDTANLNTAPAIIDLTATAGGVAMPTSQGNFIGPLLPYSIAATDDSICSIAPKGAAILLNAKGRHFDVSQSAGTTCAVTVDGASVGSPTAYDYMYNAANGTHAINATKLPTGTYYTLSGNWISSVGGCLKSDAAHPGISCLSKSAKFLAGETVVLSPYDSLNVNTMRVQSGTWTGACAGSASTCTLTMDADKTFGTTAVVELVPPGGGPIFNLTKNSYHQTCADAFGAATTGDQIKISTDIASCTTTGTAGVMTKVSNQWKQADYSADSVFKTMPLTITKVGITVDPTTGFVLKL